MTRDQRERSRSAGNRLGIRNLSDSSYDGRASLGREIKFNSSRRFRNVTNIRSPSPAFEFASRAAVPRAGRIFVTCRWIVDKVSAAERRRSAWERAEFRVLCVYKQAVFPPLHPPWLPLRHSSPRRRLFRPSRRFSAIPPHRFLTSLPRTPSPTRWAKEESPCRFSPLAHYRRDRWDLNPPPVVVMVMVVVW